MPEETIRRLLYHTVRELLFNVVKHAEADEARISFRREAERIQVVVEDDGQGYDPKMEQESHLGLASIREGRDSWGHL